MTGVRTTGLAVGMFAANREHSADLALIIGTTVPDGPARGETHYPWAFILSPDRRADQFGLAACPCPVTLALVFDSIAAATDHRPYCGTPCTRENHA